MENKAKGFKGKSIFLRMWNIIAITVLVVIIGISGGCSNQTEEISSIATREPLSKSTVISDNSSNLTLGQQNALSKAEDYLNYSAFSHDGLVEQLEYEGFSDEEAVYAVDNCGADWNEQAAKKAQQYLDYSSFSRDGLIEQLEYEKFTPNQAKYGADTVGYEEISSIATNEPLYDSTVISDNSSNLTLGQQNALSKAEDYLNYSAFSHDGLVEQLEYEGFSNEEAVYAVDNCGADWNEQAAKKAQDYLEYSSFSRVGLIEQLEYEKFTTNQAIYGADAVGY
ncbi:MAG: hypothetical protein K0R15_3014 [Clostridiales bacterium]|jgi:SOS response regulatory protein OraA/RecX|nr:hypothetical protein [Clostridiales bacterium]